MNIKTVATIDGVNTVDFGNTPDRYYWIKNIGATTVHVSGQSNISAGGDGVSKIDAGEVVMIEDYDSKIYVLGAGTVEIHETNVAFCPFKLAKKGGGDNGMSYANGLSFDSGYNLDMVTGVLAEV